MSDYDRCARELERLKRSIRSIAAALEMTRDAAGKAIEHPPASRIAQALRVAVGDA